uniref:Cathepsin L protease n=1 Tax=Cerebratulus lacteus TaxID=6221 RepID=X5F5M1_CERLA|nr:cathepsin L protease [Cerebratulus lacteus]
MIRAVALLAIVATAFAAPIPDLDEEWTNFKATHVKTYEVEEELVRKAIFHNNLRIIQKHNVEADLGQHTYWMGVNEYSDWTSTEFRNYMNGYKRSNVTSGSTFMPASYIKVPASVDWRPKGYVTPVKNQGQCGSCWAFSATGSLEGQHFKKTGNLVSLSEQNLVDCSKSYGNMGCEGGLMDSAFKYIKANHGIDTEKCYPYKHVDERCHFKKSCIGATVTGYVDVKQMDENALLQASATIGPISVAIDAGHQSFQMYSHGVYNEPRCSQTQLDHGVLVVGYGTESGQDYWLVKNSWGATWGQNGYIMMSRNKNNQCGIATSASYPLV